MPDLVFPPEVILDAISDGVYVCDRDRRIVYWSPSAERITGWRASDVLGRACLEDVLNHVDKDGRRLCGKEHCPLHRAMVTGATTRVPVIVYATGRDKRRIPMEVVTAPIRDADGRIVGGVEMFRDMSASLLDLKRARKIQGRLLETNLPDDARLRVAALYRPYDIVGGDFYFLRRLDADRTGVFLADMEGHGIAAAMYTMQLSMLCERHAQRLARPGEFAAAVNDDLSSIFGNDVSFAAAVCGVIDAAGGHVRLAWAGGPPVLVARARGDIEVVSGSGMPLGFMQDLAYTEYALSLSRGDALLLFSDGAFEIHDAGTALLGVDGLVRVLRGLGYPHAALDFRAFEEKLLEFSNAIRLPDDLTLIELQLTGGRSTSSQPQKE